MAGGGKKKNSTTANKVTNAKNKGQMKTTYRGWRGLKYNWNKK